MAFVWQQFDGLPQFGYCFGGAALVEKGGAGFQVIIRLHVGGESNRAARRKVVITALNNL